MRKKTGNIMNILKQLILTVVISGAATVAHAQTSSQLSTSFLARGEQALLEVSVIGGQPDEMPEISAVKDIRIQPSSRSSGRQTRLLTGRKLARVFSYVVAGYEVGNYTIPAIEVMVDGKRTLTAPLDFTIYNPDELQWSEVKTADRTFRYASSFRVLNTKPFEHETLTTEIKVFVPADLVVADAGIPDFERDGLTAWRFQSSPMTNTINLLGAPYVGISYPSSITPTRTGKISIGPAKIRLVTQEVVMTPFPRTVNPEIYLQVPRLELEAKPLPKPAPAGFENAVGSFQITASTPVTEVQEGDPITVDLTVSGSGNLDTLVAPQLEEPEGWKVYSTTTEQRGDERRQLVGNLVFHQSLRPLEMKTEIPAFRLVYFDLKSASYKTLTTPPIPLKMTANPTSMPNPATTSQSLAVPFERMTDILAVLHPAQLTTPTGFGFRPWMVHITGLLLALILAARAYWLRNGHRFRKDPVRDAKLSELREIQNIAAADDTGFLRSAGGYIERWLGGNHQPEIQAVLAERDAVCFQTEKPKTVLAPARRSQILKLLRHTAIALTFCASLGLSSPPAQAADTANQALEAYETAKYDDAIKFWLEAADYQDLSADTLYNVGNACYRAGAPGQAALYFRRALARDTSHPEARQNLRFLERKYGSITVQRENYQNLLARFPLTAWQSLCWGGLWLCGLAFLVFSATRRGAGLRFVAAGALVVGPLIVAAGMLGWRCYPNDAEFAPMAKQAVIVAEKVAIHTDAARTSPEVIDAPPGSLCEVISESGRWAYIAFASKTRGWVLRESLEKILPEKPPTAPKFGKPKADGKSA
jgi:tetratricopeptide (TPR) repeat protein